MFRDLTVLGSNPNAGVGENAYVRKLETQHGFRFEGVNGVELDHVQVHDVFGDFVDRKSRVTQSVGGARSYCLVEELNLEARVHYLSKVRNPNPELKS